MLNQYITVGRILEEPIIEKMESGKSFCTIKLVVPRPYKNDEGIYDNDIIPIKLIRPLCDNLIEYCHKGDIVGTKGRIETSNDRIVILAEKVTFLSSAKKDNIDEDNNTNRT